MIERIRGLYIVYMVLKKARQGSIVSEIMAVHKSSTVFRYIGMLENMGYISCSEIRKGKTRAKLCYTTEKGEKLLSLIEEIKKLDQAP